MGGVYASWMAGQRIAPHRRCIGDEARRGARFSPHRYRRCTADVADASVMRRDPSNSSVRTPFGRLLWWHY
eukprot:4104379-Pyramimonas_sp.AAC.1